MEWQLLEDVFTNEFVFLRLLALAMIGTGAMVFLILQFTTSPYGRYGSTSWGPEVNPKLAWFIQEIPAFVTPLWLIFFTDCPKLNSLPNVIVLSLFLIHYFQRFVNFSILAICCYSAERV